MKSIQVFIITYNRPDSLIKAIDSVLLQTFKGFELIISDNSPNNDTLDALLTYPQFASFKYIHRKPSLTGIQHINQVISEVVSEYFMIFHDDDIMHPNMLEKLYESIQKNNNIVAVGCNAHLVKMGKIKGNFTSLMKDCWVCRPQEMIERYLKNRQIVPFPSYLYKKEIASKYYLDIQKGGKYSDAAFICDICSEGPVLLLAETLMDYYVHKGQASFSWSFKDKILQLRYIISHSNFDKKDTLILNFRIQNIYNELCRKTIRNIPFRYFVKYATLFFKYSPFIIFPRFLLKKILMKY